MCASGGCSRAINLFLIWSFLPNSFSKYLPRKCGLVQFWVKCGLAKSLGLSAKRDGRWLPGVADVRFFFNGCVASRRNHKSLLLPSCQTHTDGFLIFEFHHFNRLLFFACYHTFQNIMQLFLHSTITANFKTGHQTSCIIHSCIIHKCIRIKEHIYIQEV